MQGIIIQGQTTYYKEISENFQNWPNTVFSTWTTEPQENIEYIKSKGIHVIQSEPPTFPGDQNINYQALSTYAGLNYLHSICVKEVLKVRSDHTINDVKSLLEALYGKKLSFQVLSNADNRQDIVYHLGYIHYAHDYPSDNIIYGKIDELMKMFNFQMKANYQCPPESLLVYNYMMNSKIVFDLSYDHLIKNGITFFEGDCLNKGIKIQWLKRNHEMVEFFKDKFYYKY